MKYRSLNDKNHKVSFEDAVVRGLAPGKALYFPEDIPKLSPDFFQNLDKYSKEEIAYEAIKAFVGDEIEKNSLQEILKKTLNFEFPVVPISENIGTLELFHGPTLAFKDVGAGFMAGCLGHFVKKGNLGKITVLVATSGDTGGAVANGFLGVEGIDVVILYPKGKVSEIQEKQLTTLGQNITALEVNGNFDDCQDMVKKAFSDSEISAKRQLTSANSINVARWLPQMFYYFFAYKQLAEKKAKLAFSVPSGNFGNICAGMLAKQMGLPIDHFIASNNENNVVTRYLKSKEYAPKQSVQTISNAMDVGTPSNFVRILELFDNEFNSLSQQLSSFSYSDDETRNAIKEVKQKYNYVMDPHGAVGYLGLQDFLAENPEYYGTFLETAHPVKFLETVEEVIGEKVEIPDSIKEVMNKEKKSFEISDYAELKDFLMR
ncbi:threonine synthase [Salegentibacter mishustinae]|uniref:Threonine synthase n=1 Tax=Salegentibacter mishustinae TaxID=270918 RepID=A0A0Q9ZGF6_9FLAO|nr:threonine synthase [Salegentibacter mishustinae]KRG29202.1 threonine synthase [Salegentibacter mishustinae]PNW21748.1 threonine synthase [Salegentibacter mishustinae]PZX65088.1 threonine synthase [Salegentibacter mishustinae]GGW87401.1 threonine synthase [Salegentibacter mishustinae]